MLFYFCLCKFFTRFRYIPNCQIKPFIISIPNLIFTFLVSYIEWTMHRGDDVNNVNLTIKVQF